jgi:hypothetical protein
VNKYLAAAIGALFAIPAAVGAEDGYKFVDIDTRDFMVTEAN